MAWRSQNLNVLNVVSGVILMTTNIPEKYQYGTMFQSVASMKPLTCQITKTCGGIFGGDQASQKKIKNSRNGANLVLCAVFCSAVGKPKKSVPAFGFIVGAKYGIQRLYIGTLSVSKRLIYENNNP